ncbi:unnamed protein product [Pieris macdunnoughi]|uniref:Uncharacterized protein n=1 Tax=Pieris macdunnoughi TaxID=345717 RepID=A0A821S9Z6_9NEOP|nr:unnamed protein product [Pieris macdunnoughi]
MLLGYLFDSAMALSDTSGSADERFSGLGDREDSSGGVGPMTWSSWPVAHGLWQAQAREDWMELEDDYAYPMGAYGGISWGSKN